MTKFLQFLILFFALICASCECPLKEDLRRARQGNEFSADCLFGTWQCSYNMIIGGMEFKQIRFISNGKADITMAEQHQVDWYTETYSYSYYSNTLRFSNGNSNFSLTIKGFLFPELYLYDSFGTYTITKRRVD